MPMNQKKYEERRNELISKLMEIAQIEALPEETAKTLNQVSKKLIANVFNIVLIGEFQGGKSTTFNAICDGREISPRGAMVKTSACKISAQNLPDETTAEYAEVEWKSNEELLLTIIGLIAPYLRKKDETRFGGMSETDIAKKIDLTKETDRRLVASCIDEEWALYNEAPADYDTDALGKLDILRIGSIIVHFLNDNVIKEMKAKTKFSIEDLKDLVVFAQRWEERWMTRNVSVFKAKEVVFAFLGRVMCYLHSPNLARLGCVITDCPGLFASPWDTAVAIGAMQDADAILYLIGGERQMSQGDVRALKEIRKSKQEYKLFFAVNAKVKRDLIQNTILPVDIGILKNAGFENVSEQNIYIYHALLGLCSKNGVAIHAKTFEENSLQQFINVTQMMDQYPDNPQDLWKQLVDDLLTRYLPRNGRKKLNEIVSDVNSLGQYSGLESLTDKIEKTVILKKAEALLIGGGCHPINVALTLLETALKAKERLAIETAESFELKAEKEKQLLAQFSRWSQTEIDTIIEPRYSEPLALDFFDNVIVAHSDDLSDRISEGFAEVILSFKEIFKSLNQSAMKAKLEPIIKDATDKIITPAAEGWMLNIQNGENSIFESSIVERKRTIIQIMQKKWRDLNITEDCILLNGLDSIITDNSVGEETLQTATNTLNFQGLGNSALSGRVKMLAATLLSIPIGVVGAIVATTLVNILLATIFSVVLGFIPVIAALIAGAILGLKVGDKIKKEVKTTFKNRLRLELRASFTRGDVREQILTTGRNMAMEIQKIVHSELGRILESQKQIFEKRWTDAKNDFETSNEERVRVAKECRAMREKYIEPAHQWSCSYEKDVIEELR